MNIFISYTHKNLIMAMRIKSILEDELNHTVWMDIKEIKVMDVIDTSINQALSQCELVVVLWSKEAQVSKGVKSEIEFCRKHNIDIIPCILDEIGFTHDNTQFGTLGIRFINFDAGKYQLQSELLIREANKVGLNTDGNLMRNTEFTQILKHFSDHSNRGTTKGKDAVFSIRYLIAVIFKYQLGDSDFTLEYKNYIFDILNLLNKVDSVNKIQNIWLDFHNHDYISTEPKITTLLLALMSQLLREYPDFVSSIKPADEQRLRMLQLIYNRFTTEVDHNWEKTFNSFLQYYKAWGVLESMGLNIDDYHEFIENVMYYVSYAAQLLLSIETILLKSQNKHLYMEVLQLSDILIKQFETDQGLLPNYQLVSKAIFAMSSTLNSQGELQNEVITKMYNDNLDITNSLVAVFTWRETQGREIIANDRISKLFGTQYLEDIFAAYTWEQAVVDVKLPPSNMEKQFATQYKDLLSLSIKHDPTAMYELGQVYEFGFLGKEVNGEMAFTWYYAAALRENRQAIRKVADCYERGMLTDRDTDKAQIWLTKCVNVGYEEAGNILQGLV